MRNTDVVRRPRAWCYLFLFLLPCAYGQDVLSQDPQVQSFAPPSPSEKWNFFLNETFTPFTLIAASLDATASQLTRSAPLYGKHFWNTAAYPKRFAATLGDDTTQNFFADFLLASAFREDTRYFRRGHARGVWPRIGYAISRAVVTRTDGGAASFNWANVLGCAMSAGLSNAYYPAVSRTLSDSLTNWGTNVAGAGLTNLAPEFGPDVGRWFKRHLFRH